MPKDVVVNRTDSVDGIWYKCPGCGCNLINGSASYCPCCGAKIQWDFFIHDKDHKVYSVKDKKDE